MKNMPNLNGSGPDGMGAGTGRGLGVCAGAVQVGFSNRRGMRGLGRRGGFCRFRSFLSKDEVKEEDGEKSFDKLHARGRAGRTGKESVRSASGVVDEFEDKRSAQSAFGAADESLARDSKEKEELEKNDK